MVVKSVMLQVKIEYVNEFIEATLENRNYSIKEEGFLRFDFFQCNDDPTKFMIYEVFKSEAAINEHLKTKHFKKWVDTVSQWFIGTRDRATYTPISPMEDNFK